ncbi:uncharacterized protein BJ212DRAFT_1370340 [Suillus subaureus]|uniref:Uncharacterized protein n=1 Tax=Suillus subaureus TaxID=48587 RepID=A0A9P7E6Z4_9AGAM|nr:uncharacterized protein BJ212DRAFT_1370340 [Suillus subaureus]KAG1812527.1 hypothetical protein BJ212DRAFT_1370340 [Suillus subaureus]
MQLTLVTELSQLCAVDIDPDMKLENVMPLLEAEYATQRTKHLAPQTRSDRSRAQGYRSGAWLGLQCTHRSTTYQTITRAAASQFNPTHFAELLRQERDRAQQTELDRQCKISTLNTDLFDVEAQRRTEEAIRQQAVMENMEHALEILLKLHHEVFRWFD